MNIKKLQSFLFIILIFSTTQLFGQNKWAFDFGLGSSLNTGNVNNCNINNYASIVRNDSLLAFDFHYKFLYSSLINKNTTGNQWEETNFEINGGLKVDYLQYGKFSPFWLVKCLLTSTKDTTSR